MSKTIQIDLLPVEPGKNVAEKQYPSYYINLYIDGYCFNGMINLYEANRMVECGIVKQTKRCIRNDKDELEYFEYENNVDGSGVQFTSQVFKIK